MENSFYRKKQSLCALGLMPLLRGAFDHLVTCGSKRRFIIAFASK